MSGWNQLDTGAFESMIAETVTIKGYNGDTINAYFARPTGPGPYAGVVLVHHMPGWDEFYRETARRYAQHGYLTLCPDLYHRFGHGSPDDVTATSRAAGGPSDDQVVGDLSATKDYLRSLPNCNGKIGIMGTCSGGRYSFLTACRTPDFDAVVDCWGGAVVMTPEQLNAQRPVAPIDYTKDLKAPLLGLFGNDDQGPSPDQVNQHEEELKKHGKNYDFHRYDGAGHAFIYYHAPAYRQQQAMDAWGKIFTFFEKNLQS
ncbi:MAG: carboxymethylenebutenolidase [Chloroflexota bacterium]|jgi:carboxymethylenebutenolidase|nr:carboxymethylenebutenolidase [Chloroflexota bacterium]